MFKKLILLTFVFFVPSAFAADEWSFGEIFSNIEMLSNNITSFFFDDVPNLIDRGIAYAIEFAIYIQVKATIYAMKTGFAVAKLILSDFGFVQMIESFAGQLPPDIRQAAVGMKIFTAFNLIVEALVARLVLSYL